MEIVSIMGSGSLGREINLDPLVTGLKDEVGDILETNFQSAGIVTVKFGSESPAFSIYRTGAFQVRGASDHDDLNDWIDQFLGILSEIGFDIEDAEFEEKTAVFMDEVQQSVNLEALTIHLGLEFTEYEPEQFPGVVYRPANQTVTLLVFSSGKVLVLGTTEQGCAEAAFESLKKEIRAIS
ncbi:hypothetical protein [Halorussus aquaticus]|uniref:Transcription factor n=1 Tax=Halorussus aquaticus TaxID=2953748 RepID=A0ABD5Q7Z4_9EURY|nr:hypothetical protein [Halorussus aquaticus]